MTTSLPVLGVIAVMVEDDRALLVQRSKQPDAGLWGFPGGHVELGETVAEAALRELREETGIIGTAGGVLDVVDVIVTSGDAVTTHYALVAISVQFVSGTVMAADDARDARWWQIETLASTPPPMSAGVMELVHQASAETARQSCPTYN